MFNVIYFTEKVAFMVATNFVSFSKICWTISAGETLSMEQTIANFSSFVRFRENLLANGTAGSEQTVEVLLTIELSKFWETGVSKRSSTSGTLETVLMKAALTNSQDVLVFYRSVTLCTDFHVRHYVRNYEGNMPTLCPSALNTNSCGGLWLCQALGLGPISQ